MIVVRWLTGAACVQDEEGSPARLRLLLWLERLSCIDAAVELGVERGSAQTCAAMCAAPGGVFLDIKSAYSSPADIQMFVAAMGGIGIHCKASCQDVLVPMVVLTRSKYWAEFTNVHHCTLQGRAPRLCFHSCSS